MLDTTVQIVKSAFKGDPTISPRDRAQLLASLRKGPESGKANPAESDTPSATRIVRRRQAAEMYGCSLRLIDRLAAQGILRKVRLPGRRRGAGFLQSELLAVIAAQGNQGHSEK